MTTHKYIENIKNNSPIKKEDKESYIKTLEFNSNKIIIDNNNFNMNRFSEDFNIITTKTNNLYVYLYYQDLNGQKLSTSNDYYTIYNNSINNINNIFSANRIILHSSTMFTIDDGNKILKSFLIYDSDFNFNKYYNEQQNVKNKIALINNLQPWDFRKLISSINQMQLYKTLYSELFTNNLSNKISSFFQSTKNDKIHSIGIIKKTKNNQNGTESKHTINVFKIEPEFLYHKDNIIFNFTIVTKVFIAQHNVHNQTTYVDISIYNKNHVQIAILGDVIKIPNYFDKKSITFNINKFDDSKFNLYCSSIDILKKYSLTTLSTRVLTTHVNNVLPILENETFYKNNIKKTLEIGLVYEEHIENKILEYSYYIHQKMDKKEIIDINYNIKLIKLQQNSNITDIVNQLNSSQCDCFICLTDIDIYSDDENNNVNNTYDYYKEIKNYILNQNLVNKQSLITQGLIITSDTKQHDESDDENNDVIKENKNDNFNSKIKTAFYELCTKYIFYNNNIYLNSTLKDGHFYIISFNAPNNLASLIEIKTNNNIAKIINKELIKINSKNGNEFKKDSQLINYLSKKINNYTEILNKIKSYDDFVVYDVNESNFILCSSQQTYLLSDNEFAFRKNLILNSNIGKTYTKKNKNGIIETKQSVFVMAPLIPLYNIPASTDRQIYLFEINNELYYFVGNEMKKTLEHPQSPLVKMYLSENNDNLLDFYFKLITCNVVRNSLNTKTTLIEKFSKIHMIN